MADLTGTENWSEGVMKWLLLLFLFLFLKPTSTKPQTGKLG